MSFQAKCQQNVLRTADLYLKEIEQIKGHTVNYRILHIRLIYAILVYSDGDSQHKGYSAGCFNALQILQAKTSPWINEDLNQVFGSVPGESAVICSSAGCRAKWDPPGGSSHFEVPRAPYGLSKTSLARCLVCVSNAALKNRRRVGHLLCLPSLIQMHLVDKDDELKSHPSSSLSGNTPSSLQAEQVPNHHRLLLLEEHLAAAWCSDLNQETSWAGKWTSTVEGLLFCFFYCFLTLHFT